MDSATESLILRLLDLTVDKVRNCGHEPSLEETKEWMWEIRWVLRTHDRGPVPKPPDGPKPEEEEDEDGDDTEIEE